MDELEQRLYERGVHADSLLSQELFLTTVKELSQGLMESIADSEPHEHERRDNLYYMHKGLMDVMSVINKLSQHRQQLDAEEPQLDEDMTADVLSDIDMLDL